MINKMKLSLEEKDFLEKITAVSLHDKKTVNEVFQALLRVISIELFKDEDTIYIPYIGSITIKYEDEIISGRGVDVKVELQIEPSETLQQEIKQFSEGDISLTQEYMRGKISENIIERVEI